MNNEHWIQTSGDPNYFPKDKQVEKFNSGAIRSSDAADTDYWLITPIGLERLASIYSRVATHVYPKPQLVQQFYENINHYLSGHRDEAYLENAAYSISELIALEYTGKTFTEFEENLGFYNIPPIILKELAATYSEGKIKYSAYNCELGFPVHDLLNHAERHVTEWRLGVIEDRHLPHALWNILMAMHSEEKWPHLNEPYLRGEGCELTEAIRKRIDEEIKAKLVPTTGDARDSEIAGRGTNSRATHSARRTAKRSG